MKRRRWIVVGAVVVLLVVAGGVWFVKLRDSEGSRFAEAVALAPESSIRFSWTDWAGVRDELGVDLSTSSPTDALDEFLLDAFDRDLASMSALEESAPTIHEEMGFSPASIDWELVAQGEEGAVVMMGLPESFDVGALRDSLRATGYAEPDDDDDGIWQGGVDLLEGLAGPVTPQLAALQIDEEAGVLFGSDTPGFLQTRAEDERDGQDDGVSAVVDAAGDALSAVAYTGDHACSALAMTAADPADRTRAGELIEEAGEVHPLAGFAIAGLPGGDVRVTMAFDNEDQARTDSHSRGFLASGAAPGQGGSFPERFTLGRVAVTGRVLTMPLDPVDGAFVVSDLSHGPVLFATC